MYEFQAGGRRLCIDATTAFGTAGRLINHSQNGNVAPEKYKKDNSWRIRFRATKDIDIGEEILYDYSDLNEENIKANRFLERKQ